MKVAIGSDHAGSELRQFVREWLEKQGAEVVDFGTHESDSVDYPDYAGLVARAILAGEAERGVLVCGSGMGMSIAANRFEGIRAALCREPVTAEFSRSHNNSNVLVLGERFTGIALADAILQAWWETPFEGGRHARRVAKIEQQVTEREDHV